MVNWKQKEVKIIGCHVPRAPVQDGLPVSLDILCRISRKTAVQTGVCVFCNY